MRIAGRLLLLLLLAGVAGADDNQPQRVESYRQLSRLIKQHTPRYYGLFRPGLEILAMAGLDLAGAQDYSQTLLQVAGVDEGDTVKTDGQTIFQINQGRVLALRASPPADPADATVLELPETEFYPQELYMAGDRLVVIGTAWHWPETWDDSSLFFSLSTVEAVVFDVSDPSAPVCTRTIEVEGDFVATRRIGPIVYLLTRRYPDFYASGQFATAGARRVGMLPRVRSTRSGRRETFRPIRLDDCYYFPGFDDPNYLVIAAFNATNDSSRLQAEAYLGAGTQVYASTGNLYVAGSRAWDWLVMSPMEQPADGTVATTDVPDLETTQIYKFALNNGCVTFVGQGSIQGSILNQFSMDEHEGFFRVAATTGSPWGDTQANHLYVLGPDMQPAGAVTNIAPGERIYAARFMGDHAFLVTFQNIDPLFAIDLSEPANPVVVGHVELPGYSNFLLPLDDNHLIGIGKDVTVVAGSSDGDVEWWDGQAFYQGMKLTLFDVTDLAHPSVLHSLTIGQRGTESQALWDHHAILFDAARGLLAFPITVAEVAGASEPPEAWEYGDSVFQGAYVYDVSVAGGFTLRGTVTHQTDADPAAWDWNAQIDRLLYIGDGLWSLSNARIKVNDLNTLEETHALDLPQPDESEYWSMPGGLILPVLIGGAL